MPRLAALVSVHADVTLVVCTNLNFIDVTVVEIKQDLSFQLILKVKLKNRALLLLAYKA